MRFLDTLPGQAFLIEAQMDDIMASTTALIRRENNFLKTYEQFNINSSVNGKITRSESIND
jgi:hypothetical protein